MPNWSKRAQQIAREEGIDPVLFDRQMSTESVGYDPAVISGRRSSPAGAQGIAQFMPDTAKGLGINPLNPEQALRGAAKLMRGYIQKFGGWDGALRAYNAGPGAVAKSRGFAETNRYVRQIIGGRTPQPLQKPNRAVPVGQGGGGRQAAAPGATQPDLGQASNILATVTQALQSQTKQTGVGASAPALPAFAARPVAAGAGAPQAGVAPVAARQQRLGAAIQSVLAASDTSVPGVLGQTGGAQRTVGGQPGGPGVQGRTLYIGDSLGVGTEPSLKKLLGGHVDANVVGGRSSENGIAALKAMYGKRGYQNIVLDLGTNDMTAGQLEQSVRRAQKIAPNARIYIPTLNGPFATRQKNRVLQRLAAASPNIELVPWRSNSGGHLAGDGIHATAQGYQARAHLIAQTMGWTAPAPAAGGGGDVRSLIHPHGHWGGSEGPTVALFKALGAPLGLQVASNKRHNTNPYSGSRSDHDYGQKSSYAIDASNGSSPTPQMDEYAYRLMHALGFTGYKKGTPINVSQGVTTINGLRFQVIYRGSGAAFGGNHLNHVHLGVRRV